MPFYKPIGTRVRLMTPAGGCYDGLSGVITGYKDGLLNPVGDPACSHYAVVKFDAPVAANAGETETIFPWSQVFDPGTAGTYWHPIKPKAAGA
ncbi:MAG: hypothetical protein NC311_10130 [Muribaculaceae bacterium]|nr:hypothetical protein [Muribaculaceae bacterium]